MAHAWRDRAACQREDLELFFPADTRGNAALDAEAARRVCRACPVVLACLEDALAVEGGAGETNRYGIRGGLDGRQRHGIYKRRLKAVRVAG